MYCHALGGAFRVGRGDASTTESCHDDSPAGPAQAARHLEWSCPSTKSSRTDMQRQSSCRGLALPLVHRSAQQARTTSRAKSGL